MSGFGLCARTVLSVKSLVFENLKFVRTQTSRANSLGHGQDWTEKKLDCPELRSKIGNGAGGMTEKGRVCGIAAYRAG